MKSTPIKIEELDFFFMSYDEPNADKHWADLLSKVPWAQRVHGVKGFDAVHRRCGELSTTPYLITVDADTIVHKAFLEGEVGLPINGAFNLAWASDNAVNGLRYANGGVKVWQKEFASNMAFHELGDTVDFCWSDNFTSIPRVASTLHINGSPFQAFRAGYREGVKLSTDQGSRVAYHELENLPAYQRHLLTVWCTIGADVENGDWAIAGALKGLLDNVRAIAPVTTLTTFEHIEKTYNDIVTPSLTGEDCRVQFNRLVKGSTPFTYRIVNAEESAFIRAHFRPC